MWMRDWYEGERIGRVAEGGTEALQAAQSKVVEMHFRVDSQQGPGLAGGACSSRREEEEEVMWNGNAFSKDVQ